MQQNSPGTLYDNIMEAIKLNQLTLPSQPDIVISLRNLSGEPSITYQKLKEIISKDPVLTKRIIDISNSALFRGDIHIESLNSAISRLGTAIVISFSVSEAIQQLYQAKNKMIAKKMQEVWDHACDVSAVSFVLSKRLKVGSPEEVMLGGLLHEIGILPILTYAESIIDTFSSSDKSQSVDNEINLLEEIIQNNNTDLSEMILNSWYFPEKIVSIPKMLHKSDRVRKKPDMIDIVLVAKVYALKNKKHRLTEIKKRDILAYARLGIDPEINFDTIPQIQEAQEIFRTTKYTKRRNV